MLRTTFGRLRANAFRRFADNRSGDSVASVMRARRFRLLVDVIAQIESSPIRILDVGGSPGYWTTYGSMIDQPLEVTIANLVTFDPIEDAPFRAVEADARDLSEYGNDEFDVVFSNSVIEHVGGFEDQRAMAREVVRVGRRVVLQTPNYWFPIEPHFVFPFFQFLPIRLRAELHRRFDLGWMQAAGTAEAARRGVEGIQLLDRGRLQELFPEGRIVDEKFAGLVKSFTVIC